LGRKKKTGWGKREGGVTTASSQFHWGRPTGERAMCINREEHRGATLLQLEGGESDEGEKRETRPI